MLEAFGDSLGTLFSCPCALGFLPERLLFLFLGTFIGLAIGVVPGWGGVVGLALVLPFTFGLDPYAAIAMLIGLLSVTAISDTIPAVFFAVPGTTGSQATIMDGFPMARKGESGRALGAAYTASLVGGLLGAIGLAASLPIMQPMVRAFGAPEFLMLGLMGISMVAVLSGRAPVKGIIMGAVGLTLGAVGLDTLVGTQRWVFGEVYLWDGVGLVPLSLGLFAIPEIMDLVIRGTRISDVPLDRLKGVARGARDVVENWFLVLRCSLLGAFLGAVPGVGVSVIDWLAYGHAMQTTKNSRETFTKGDVRGVIAPESANNSKNGGALIPTLAFGVPGSAGMALLLGGLLIHGFRPGPDMLTSRLDVTYTMIISLALATVLGTGILLAASIPLAKLSMVRIQLLAPLMLGVIFLASFQSSAHMGDLLTLLFFGGLGWVMKRLGWPRPPLILAFVLSGIVENNFYISTNIYGAAWVGRPVVVVITLAILGFFVYGAVQSYRDRRKQRALVAAGEVTDEIVEVREEPFKLRLNAQSWFTFLLFLSYIGLFLLTLDWPTQSRLLPWVSISIILPLCALQFVLDQIYANKPASEEDVSGLVDLPVDRDQPRAVVMRRAANIAAWIAGLAVLIWLVGFLIGIPLFIVAYLRLKAREPPLVVVAAAVSMSVFMVVLFHYMLHIAWSHPVVGGPQRHILALLGG